MFRIYSYYLNIFQTLFYLCYMLIQKISRYILFLTFLGIISSCNEYGKLLKSTDYNLKYDAAVKYYEENDYYRAYQLIDELLGVFNGTNKAEKLYYYLAYCDYHLGDYTLAATRFNIFYKRYPGSQWSEEALFMSAYCNYLTSPNFSLDQTETYTAIEELQMFMNLYPTSSRIDSCNVIMDKLRDKLEKKAYENAYLYYHTENYKSAIIAFNSLLENYPDIDSKEKIEYYVIKSKFLLAQNSIESKKKQRYEDFINSYIKFADNYSTSNYLKELESLYEKATKTIKAI